MTHHSPGRKQNLFTFQNTAQNFQVKLQLHSTNLSQYFATLTKGVVETVYSPPTKPRPPTQTIITNSAAGQAQPSKWKWNATVPSSLSLPIAGVQWNESGNVLCNSDEPMNVVRNASRTGFRSDTRIMLDNQAVDKPLCSS